MNKKYETTATFFESSETRAIISEMNQFGHDGWIPFRMEPRANGVAIWFYREKV